MKSDRYGQSERLSPEQITLLFTEGLLTTRDRALFGVCLYTACRINEACTLLTADVMGIKGIRDKILIRSINTKGKQDTREIQIHPKLKDYLEAYQPDIKKEHLFPGRHSRGHIHKASADKILREACKRVGLEGVSTHSFRRTALTQMHNAGVPMRHIQSISGHRTLAALARYLDVTDEQKQSAIFSLNF